MMVGSRFLSLEPGEVTQDLQESGYVALQDTTNRIGKRSTESVRSTMSFVEHLGLQGAREVRLRFSPQSQPRGKEGHFGPAMFYQTVL